jgi:hypothetical protein
LFVVCSPVGKYFQGTSNSIKLYADDKFTRAHHVKINLIKGGTGNLKIGFIFK